MVEPVSEPRSARRDARAPPARPRDAAPKAEAINRTAALAWNPRHEKGVLFKRLSPNSLPGAIMNEYCGRRPQGHAAIRTKTE